MWIEPRISSKQVKTITPKLILLSSFFFFFIIYIWVNLLFGLVKIQKLMGWYVPKKKKQRVMSWEFPIGTRTENRP